MNKKQAIQKMLHKSELYIRKYSPVEGRIVLVDKKTGRVYK